MEEVIKATPPMSALDLEADKIASDAKMLKQRRAQLAVKKTQAKARDAQQKQNALAQQSA